METALLNALKRSGVKLFRVALRRTAERVHLSVRDAGVGVDKERILNRDEIGLITIRERARFVNGTVAIRSGPNVGTTIEMELPPSSELATVEVSGGPFILLRLQLEHAHEFRLRPLVLNQSPVLPSAFEHVLSSW